MLIQMSGVPGSGKSTLSKEIASIIGAVIVDHDVVKSPIVISDFAINKRVSPQEVGKLAYDIDFALADYYLSQDLNVIIDSPCAYDSILKNGLDLAEKHNTPYKYIWCYLDNIDVINNRLKTRKKLPSQILHAVPSNHPDMKNLDFNKWINGMKHPDKDFLVINTEIPIENYLSKVLEYINPENHLPRASAFK